MASKSPSSIAILFLLVFLPFSVAQAAQKDLARTDHFPSAEGKLVVIHGNGLDVRMRVADVDQIAVETELHIGSVGEEKAQRWIESHTPVFADEEGRLSVLIEPGKSGFLGFGRLSARARLALLVPGNVVPDLTTTGGNLAVRGDFPHASTVRLRTSTGDIEMTGAAKALDVRSTSGDVQLEVIRPLERLFARTSSGEVRLVGGAREARVETASSKIWLENLSGDVSVSTSTGKITLRWDRLPAGASVRVRSSSGRVQLVLPAGIRPQGTLTTTTGNIRSDFPGEVTEDGSALTLQGDGPGFDVESASGDILLTTNDMWED
jgi:DUF4097 and DUF4098 domain-containing protein YvlB